jgi:phosphatidylglycerol:prolipoprotein diacylglycerol transferase
MTRCSSSFVPLLVMLIASSPVADAQDSKPLPTPLALADVIRIAGERRDEICAGLWVMQRRQLPKIAVLAAATPALAIGQAIGRIGCFLVGDDYGRPSHLPWAVAFPQGLPPTTLPLHPTQLYQAAGLLPLALLLFRWRRRNRSDEFVLGAYLFLAGSLRFVIEFV